MYQEKEKKLAISKYKRIKVAIICEGQIYGDDDAIAVRPYQSSLKCITPEAQALALSRGEFQRTFRASYESKRSAINQAKER